ncbi:hypothetical protein [Pseudidiomarina sp. YC-516-91]|uniref:hypothetical protein n=1 Tax=Pseudidiomarina salilacus TaxID=3384452 RepID=UPI0039847415
MNFIYPKVYANRATRIVEEAMRKLSLQFALLRHLRPFSYWDVFYGDPPAVNTDVFRLVSNDVLQRVDSKKFLAREAKRLGLEGHLVPYTFESVAEAQTLSRDANSIWFMKPVYATGGRGIECIRHRELNRLQLPNHHILQTQITDLELFDGRKYTARAYVFIFNKHVYCFDDGFVMIHGAPFDAASTDFSAQVDHADYYKPDGCVKMATLADLPDYPEKLASIVSALAQLNPVLEPLITASSPYRYALIGIDLLFQQHNKVQIVELNTKANFVHTDSINERLNVPFFAAFLSLLYLQNSHRRLTQI